MSLTHTFQSLVICKELGEEKQMADCYRTIGIIHHKVGLYEKAIKYYNKSLDHMPKENQQYNIAQLYWDLGKTYREAKQYKEAEENFVKSAGIQKELGNQEELADVYNSLGNLFKETGAYEKALNYLSQSLAISESINHAELRTLALHNTGYVLYQQKKYTEAKAYYTKALAQSEKVSDFPELLIWIHRDMGLNELALKDAEKAIPYLEKGEAIAQGSKQTKLEIELTAILSQVYKKLRNIDKALYYSEKSRSIQAENLIPEIKRLGDEFEKKNTIDGFKENSIQKREGDSNRFFYIVLSSLISLLVGGSGIYFIKRRQNKTMGGKGKLVEIEERLEMVLTKVAEVMKNKSSYSQLIQQEAQAIYAKMQEIEAHQQHISKRGISKRKLKELWDMLQNSKSFLALANQQKANSIDHS
jgi:tetratricopeptide (TPR) repeat protein